MRQIPRGLNGVDWALTKVTPAGPATGSDRTRSCTPELQQLEIDSAAELQGARVSKARDIAECSTCDSGVRIVEEGVVQDVECFETDLKLALAIHRE